MGCLTGSLKREALGRTRVPSEESAIHDALILIHAVDGNQVQPRGSNVDAMRRGRAPALQPCAERCTTH